MKNRKGLYAKFERKRKVLFLDAYYYQGGKWYKVKRVKGL